MTMEPPRYVSASSWSPGALPQWTVQQQQDWNGPVQKLAFRSTIYIYLYKYTQTPYYIEYHVYIYIYIHACALHANGQA